MVLILGDRSSIPLPNQSGRDKGLASVFVLADGADLVERRIECYDRVIRPNNLNRSGH